MQEVVIEIPLLAPGLNGNKGMIRMHFTKYVEHKKKWIWYMKAAVGTMKAPIPCEMEINRYYCTQPMDIDNSYATAKIVFDAMKETGFIPDDDHNCIVGMSVLQHKVKTRKEEKTVIRVTAAEVAKPAPSE